MKLKLTLFFLLLIGSILYVSSNVSINNVYAQFGEYLYIGGDDGDDEDSDEEDEKAQEQIDDLRDNIEEYEAKLAELAQKEQTLSNQIAYFDSQISLTQLRIESTVAQINQKERQIDRLGDDIDNLTDRISRLRDSIDYQQEVFGERMRARYKVSENSPIVVLFGSTTLQTLINKAKYLKAMEIQDQKLLAEMTQTRENFTIQKDLFEEKKSQSEELKAQIEAEKANLEGYRVNLEDQKLQQDQLLKLTQNDEAKYQQLLAEAQRELDQITGAAQVLKNTEPREVERGELIGVQGNTGYSFGDHLHFGVYKYDSFDDIDGWNWYYSNYVNPSKKLKSKEVYWNTGCESSGNRNVGSGDWKWPMDNPIISQGFGHTCYSNAYYGGREHPAYDMYGPGGAYIYAVEEGDAFFCRNCLGDGGNGVFIFHPDGYMTLYWHLQ